MKSFDLTKSLRASLIRVVLPIALGCGGLFLEANAAETEKPFAHRVVDVGSLSQSPVSLTEYFEVLEDPTLNLTLTDVLRPENATRFTSVSSAGKSLNLGFTSSAYWLKLRFRNSRPQALDQMLEITVARLAASVDVHQQDELGNYQSVHTGYLSPFSARPYKHHFYVFPVTVSPGAENVIYFRLQSPAALNVPARLWARDAFHQYERNDYTRQAVYLGMVLAMMSFNLLLFIALRDFNYLLYVVFVGCAAMTIAANNGVAIEFFFGEFPVIANSSTMVGASITLVALLLFMRQMIAIKALVPRLDQLLLAFVVVHLCLPVALLISFQHALRPALAFDGATAVLMMLIGIVCAVKKDRGAWYFLAAFSVLCLAGLITSLGGLGILPTSSVSEYGVQIGSAIEMIVLAFALADRYNVMRMERARAQQDALAAQTLALQAEQKVVETLRVSERLLEGRVQERTLELSQSLTRLKQTQDDLIQTEKLAALGSLVAGVAHELNTPIGNALVVATALEDAAKGTQEAMARGDMRKSALLYFSESAVTMATLIVRSCNRAATLISSFKQIAVDQSSEQRRVFDLRSLVEDNISTLRPSFKDQPWIIEIDIPPNVSCDSYPGPLGQIVTGLVSNALIHAFEGRQHGMVRVTGAVEGNMAEVQVVDDGSGIAEATLSKIFDPFFTTQLGKGSSGLGLTIARNLATGLLGGQLSVTSTAGQGTRFVLRFPIVGANAN